jgi:hypothetical protein
MATILNRTTTFATNDTVTAAGLHNLIDDTSIYAGLITTQTELTTVGTADQILIAVDGVPNTGAPRRATVQNLFDDALTGGTYTNLNLTGALTYGTATGNRTVSTSATITTGTIPNLTSSTANITLGTIPTLTAGTTTSTAANITNGTVQTLTASTATITTGTIATLKSTTGTIGNLSTTLAGDFTISQGTGTLGTTGATLGTYGGATSVPVLAINAKGQVTSTGTAAITSGLTGFRNRIINGDMRIDQRNAGASHTPVTQTYSIDRWNFQLSQASKLTAQRFAITSGQDVLDNNTYALNATSTSAYSVTSSDYFLIGQFIEGFNCADLGWGTSGAKTITISFWVTSSLTGTFGGALQNSAITRSYPFTYSISLANTWEKKTITIAGDTSGTWVTGNGLGIRLYFGLGAGSTVSGTAGSWASANYLSATGAVSVVGTSGAAFYITGVQLEAGSTATDFERRPIGTELALCQRYFCKTYSIDTAPASITNEGAHQAMPYASATYRLLSQFQFPSEMRASPQVTMYSPNNGATGQWYGIDVAGNLAGGLEYAGTRSVCVTNPVATASAGGRYLTHMVATSEL